MNVCLYSPTAPQTLLSLGQLHSCGGSFHSSTRPDHLLITADGSTILDSSPLTPHTNLYPTSRPNLMAALHSSPHLTLPPSGRPPTSLFPPTITRFITQHPPSPPTVTHPTLHAYEGTAPPIFPASTAPNDEHNRTPKPNPTPPTLILPPTQRISKEQYSRVLAAIQLHNDTAHTPDPQLCLELSTGKHSYSNLTPNDVTLMRRIVGPCPQCTEGRAFKPAASRSISTTPPASKPGETISFDPHKLPNPVLGGFTHMITMVDEHSGHISQPGTISKTTNSMFNSINKTVQQTFNANGHRVDTLHGDAERVNTSLAPPLGSIGVKLKVSLPGHHAHRAERKHQTIDTRARSVAATLPYHLPPELHLLLKQSVGEVLNNSVCKASAPLTPNEIVSGFKPTRPPVGFGRCAMVLQPDDKRRAISLTTGTPLHQIPVTELGVSMGLQPGTDRTYWLLANGIVVPRIPIGPLLPPHHVPFNWKIRPVNSIQPPPAFSNLLLAPDIEPSPLSIEPTTSPHPPSPILNTPIQHPNLLFTPSLDDSAHPPYIHPTIPPYSPLPSIPPGLTEQPNPNLTVIPLPPPPPIPVTVTESPPLESPLPTPNPPTLTLALPPPDELIILPTHDAHHAPPPPQSPHAHTLAPPPSPIYRIATRSRSSQSDAVPATPTTRAPYSGWGSSYLCAAVSPTGHQLRKRINIQTAALRDRTYRLANPVPANLNNRATDIRPVPPPRQQSEWPLHKALLILPPDKVHAAVNKEMKKIFVTYGSLKVVPRSNLEPNAVYVPTKLIIREKLNGDITARMPLGGDRQPPHTYNDTHAGTSDVTHRMFVLAAAKAHAAHQGIPLITFDFDVPAAFLNKNALTRAHTNGTQLFTRTSNLLPPPYKDVTCAVEGAHYGLKQSNHIYDQDFINLLINDGFTPCASHPYSFAKWSIPGLHALPSHHIFVSMHVDDGDGNTTCPKLYAAFKDLIIQRYGDLPFHSPSQGTCGQVQVTNRNNSTTLHSGPYIRKMLTRIGMENVPPALSPDVKGLFEPSTDSTPLLPAARSEYRTINGELIHILPTRHDCRKTGTHLLTKGEHPDAGDAAKQLHLLRYLKSCPDLGPTFSADPSNFPRGVELHSSSDCAHNVHPGGHSHGAFTITVGKPGASTAPFLVYSAAEKGVSLSPTEAEYVLLSRTAKSLIHFRQFAEDLGFPQPLPSIMLEDNASAIKLATTPLIPAKSRHIALKEHHVRWAFKTNQIQPQHQGSCDIVPDAATKYVGPSRFLYFRNQVFQPPAT